MKKLELLLAFLMAFGMAEAQTLDSIAHHYCSDPLCYVDMNSTLALRDGTLLACCQIYPCDIYLNWLDGGGHMLYKVDPHGPAVIDSVFIESDGCFNDSFLMERNPLGDDNILVSLECDPELMHSSLYIRFFDDDLVFDTAKMVCIPICDTLGIKPFYCLDPGGDVIVKFKQVGKCTHFARVGLDGTMKDHRTYDDQYLMGITTPRSNTLGIFNEDPLEFCCWGVFPSNKHKLFVLDSLLNIKNTLTLPERTFGMYLHWGYGERVLNCGDDTFLYTSRYDSWTSEERGVHVTRYKKEGLTQLNTVRFQKYDYHPSIGSVLPFGLASDNNGGYYCVYHNLVPNCSAGQVGVARLDQNLNVIWHRFCLEPQGYSREATANVTVMDDGTIAVGGMVWEPGWAFPNHFFFLFLNNDGVGLPGTEAYVRPYTFFPNPVGDQLHLQFSPDITPTGIELIDLQGRLVSSQSDQLETVGMEGLPAGVYTLRVTLSNGTVYSDKVVKQ